jgi:Spy/CpxP family protein refolding chaperone
MNMKLPFKTLLLLLALGVAGGLSFARAADDVSTPLPTGPDATAPANKDHADKGDRPMRGGRGDMAKMLKEKLNLTDDQVKKIEDIRKSHADELKAARGDRAKMGDIMKAMHDETRAVLTPDQQKEFDQMRPPGGPGGRHGDRNKDSGTPPPPPPAPPPPPPSA